jgi:hypothetical protein
VRTHRDRVAGITALALITITVSGGSAAAQATASKSVLPHEINCQGATAREEALIRKQIQIMHPEVLPLRVIFVPHWKYVDNTRVFRLRVPKGYTSVMFTHLPSRTVFIDADRYVSDDSLAYWVAHELGHLATDSINEADAEKAAAKYRKRLKAARGEYS